MSWGERSCGRVAPCGYNPTIETCNVNCPGYRWDGSTPPDSGKPPTLTRTQIRLMRKYAESQPADAGKEDVDE